MSIINVRSSVCIGVVAEHVQTRCFICEKLVALANTEPFAFVLPDGDSEQTCVCFPCIDSAASEWESETLEYLSTLFVHTSIESDELPLELSATSLA